MTTTYRTLISATELLALEKQHQSLLLIECSFDLTDTDAGERGWRDTLVVTLRSGGFQGP